VGSEAVGVGVRPYNSAAKPPDVAVITRHGVGQETWSVGGQIGGYLAALARVRGFFCVLAVSSRALWRSDVNACILGEVHFGGRGGLK